MQVVRLTSYDQEMLRPKVFRAYADYAVTWPGDRYLCPVLFAVLDRLAAQAAAVRYRTAAAPAHASGGTSRTLYVGVGPRVPGWMNLTYCPAACLGMAAIWANPCRRTGWVGYTFQRLRNGP